MFPTASFRVLMLVAALSLAACDSAEERADKHYQSGLALLESGDVQRAMVEFRNVFALDESHRDARLAYAKAARSVGNVSESYVNYLRLVEQDPEDMPSRLALAEMAILTQNWEEAERHGRFLIEAKVEIAGADIAALALVFREAVLDKDQARVRELTREAEALAEGQPDNPILHRLLVEGYMSENEDAKAIAIADRAIASEPDSPTYYRVKALLLSRSGDQDALEEHLRATIAQFPEDQETKSALIRLLARGGKLDRAEEFLRAQIAVAGDRIAAHVSLITFLQQMKGNESALAETEDAIALYDEPGLLEALRSGILFDLGRRDEAVTQLQALVSRSEPGQETDRYKVTLAKMLAATANEVGARKLIEEVLARDPGQGDALKMSAAWLIEGDRTDEALAALRQALDQEPEDAEAMTLMARAHERSGNQQLAQDLLALAVEASGNAPAESVRYARLLIGQKRHGPAEEVLIAALKAAPGDLTLLRTLAEVYLHTENWPRAQQVEATLRRSDNSAHQLAAEELRLQTVARREGREKGVAYLEDLIGSGEGSTSAKIALIRARLADKNAEGALALARELVAELPGDARARMVLGNTQFAAQDLAGAEGTFRALMSEGTEPKAGMQLVRVLGAQGREDEARSTIDTALATFPDDADLLWARASYLEKDNKIDEAIAVYEMLYEQNSGSLVLANNLASLLSTYRSDPESIERAYTVARRLRGTNVPPLQDTYGWILFLRGEAAESLAYLEPAAAALTRDPVVQYHLARAYLALDRKDDALKAFRAAIEVAPEDDPRDLIAEARTEIDRLAKEIGE